MNREKLLGAVIVVVLLFAGILSARAPRTTSTSHANQPSEYFGFEVTP